jgi:ATP-dependent Clp protease ATP-binding subunit ClpB
LHLIEKELSELREKSAQMKLRWQHEKELIQSVRGVKEQIEALHVEEQKAEREGELCKSR